MKFMNKIYCVLLLVMASACSTLQMEQKKLVWEENFKGNSIDWSRWSKIRRGGAEWQRHMSDFDSCYAVRNGKLILRGIRNRSLPNDTAPYLTGGISTRGKVDFREGRIEVKARLGEARGAWPAFWMLPENEPWPDGGEIDIMEHLNHDSIAYQTVHSRYTYTLHHGDKPKQGSTGPINRGKYNVYAVEITKDSLSFYINDRHTFSYPRVPEKAGEGQYVFTDHPFYLLLDMQLGGNWVGKVHAEDLPVEMHIKWVRYYRKN